MSSMKNYNILLFGETGTGKSLFINSFANYFHFDSLREAIESEERVNLIPSTFKVTDANYEDHEISCGQNDGNERTKIGESFTVSCKSYKFQSGDVSVRLIDTPGVGDTRGEEVDRSNLANILNYINYFDDLHAIGIVMNNTQTKLTDRFSDCLKLLMTNLNKSAWDNIVFILTNNNMFKPGPVKDVLDRFVQNELKDSTLKLDKERMFCFDNSSYEFLIATQQGVKLDEDDFDSQDFRWRKSSVEMRRLLKHVSGLTPYKVRDTMSLNDVRQFIKVIQPFLPTVINNITENSSLIIKFKNHLQMQDEKVKNIKSDVNLKQMDVKIVPIENAITVCTSPKCREIIVIGEKEMIHYPKQCCKGCIVANSWKWWCDAIDWKGYCKKCGCHKDEHERRFYKTEKVSTNLFTDEAVEKINKANSEKEKLKIKIAALRERRDQLMKEQRVMEDAQKKFAKFLQVHALTKPPEQKSTESDATYYTKGLVSQKYEKEIAEMECMSIDEFYTVKTTLLNLPISGNNFKEVLEANAKGLTTSVALKESVKTFSKKILS